MRVAGPSGTATRGALVGTVAVVVIAAAVVSAGMAIAAPTISIVDGPASVSRAAVRVAPPSPAGPTVAGCPVFPADNAWNTDVSSAPLHPRSAQIVAKIQSIGGRSVHPDFGSDPTYGIPFVVVPPTQPPVPVAYDAYGDESEPGPFPIPLDARVEGGSGSDGDRHVIAVQQGTCHLYELYRAFPANGGWAADSGARWNLQTGALRPLGWTSADAAGLPIVPGLVRIDEVRAGAIRHALRVTFAQTQRGYVLPATHAASSRTDQDLPPMGLRLRLSAGFDLSGFTGQSLVIATAMQRYGLIVADNGSNWFVTGQSSPLWDDDDLEQLKRIPGSAFEVVDSGEVQGR